VPSLEPLDGRRVREPAGVLAVADDQQRQPRPPRIVADRHPEMRSVFADRHQHGRGSTTIGPARPDVASAAPAETAPRSSPPCHRGLSPRDADQRPDVTTARRAIAIAVEHAGRGLEIGRDVGNGSRLAHRRRGCGPAGCRFPPDPAIGAEIEPAVPAGEQNDAAHRVLRLTGARGSSGRANRLRHVVRLESVAGVAVRITAAISRPTRRSNASESGRGRRSDIAAAAWPPS
jgi:hypothetical protein